MEFTTDCFDNKCSFARAKFIAGVEMNGPTREEDDEYPLPSLASSWLSASQIL